MTSRHFGSPPTLYARDADDAEAQRQAPPLSRSPAKKNEDAVAESKEANPDDDGPFSPHCADNASIWKLYMDQAKIFDDNLANLFNSDLDPLLIFAGLFSAILSAFLIEIRKGLQEDLQTMTNNLLVILIQNGTGARISSASPFKPTSTSRWVNGLWFSSLMFSLMSALGASLAKGWITQFSSSVSGSSWGDASLHCQRFRGLRRWHLKLIIQCLPILIHIAFFLFSIGLVILLLQDDLAIGVVICVLTSLILGLYFGSSIHPVFSSDSPFRTPISGMVRHLIKGSWGFEQFSPFPPGKAAQKAQALTWLITESPNVDTVNPAIRAIAGLPATPTVQDELLRGPSVALLLRVISSELAKSSPDADALSSCLYALLHLVQTAPANPENHTGIFSLKELVKPGGTLADTDLLPTSIREIALCVKGRIILLLCPDMQDTTLFETDITVLAQACADAHLRRLLIEIYTLSHDPSKNITTPAYHFRGILGNPNSANRDEIHAELVKEAILQRDLADNISTFGMATLLERLTTGPYELRRHYASLFAELAHHSTFRRQLVANVSATELSSIIASDDEDAHKDIIKALTVLAADEKALKMIIECLPGAMKRLKEKDTGIFCDIARFLTGVAHHDGIRKILGTCGTVDRILAVIQEPQVIDQRDAMVAVFKKLATYDDVRVSIFSPKTTQEIIRMTGDEDQHLRQVALNAFVAFVQYDDIRASLRGETISKILSMLEDEDLYVRRHALDTYISLVQYDDVRKSIWSERTFSYILSMLEHEDWDIRQSALDTYVALAQYDDIRASIFHSGAISKVFSMLEHENSDVRQCPLNMYLALAQYYDVRLSICSGETLLKVLSMLEDEDSDVCQCALDLCIALMRYDDVRASVCSGETFSRLLSMLEHENLDVRQCTLNMYLALVQYYDVRISICSGETFLKILSMLENRNSEGRQFALKISIALVQYDDVRPSICSGKTFSKFLSMLGHEDSNVRQCALKIYITLAQYCYMYPHVYWAEYQSEDVRASICSGETVLKLLSVLEDQDPDVRQCTLDTCFALVQHYDFRTSICHSGAISKILSMLENENLYVRQCALKMYITLVQYYDVGISICSGEILFKVLSMLEDEDSDVRQCALETYIALVPYDDVRTSMYSGEMFYKLLSVLEDQDLRVRRCALNTYIALVPYDDVRTSICFSQMCCKLLSVLEDQDRNVRQCALDTYIALVQYYDVRTTICSGEKFLKLLSMLEHEDSNVRQYALKAYTVLLQYDDVHASICLGERLPKVLSMLKDEDSDVRQCALEIYIVLMRYDDVRASICSHDTFFKLLSMLEHEESNVRQYALKAYTVLLQYDDVHASICSGERLFKVLSMLGDEDSDVCQCALEIYIVLMRYDDVRASTCSHDTSLKLLSMLEHKDSNVRQYTLKAYTVLLQYDDVRASICSHDTLFKLLSMLEHEDSNVRQYVLKAYTVLLQYDDVHVSICSGERLFKVLSMLGDEDSDVCQCALEIYIVLVQYDDIRPSICSGKTFSKLLSMLEAEDSCVRRYALDTYTTLVQYDDVRAFSRSGETISKIINMLADTDLDVQQRALGVATTLLHYADLRRPLYSPPTTSQIFPLLKHLEGRVPAGELIIEMVEYVAHDDVQNLPSRVEHILECLDGNKDSNYLLLMNGLIARQSEGGISLLGTALTNRILPKITNAHAHVRDSYTKLTLMLPPSFTVQYNDRKTLISLFKNPDPAVVKCAVSILKHFALNTQFRHGMLQLNVFGVCMRLLRRQDTATMALDIIIEFAKYENTRSSMIQPTSWIVYELLTMLRAGSADFDRCQVGLKGLLALGLF